MASSVLSSLKPRYHCVQSRSPLTFEGKHLPTLPYLKRYMYLYKRPLYMVWLNTTLVARCCVCSVALPIEAPAYLQENEVLGGNPTCLSWLNLALVAMRSRCCLCSVASPMASSVLSSSSLEFMLANSATLSWGRNCRAVQGTSRGWGGDKAKRVQTRK